MILAGDIGGTHTRLAYFKFQDGSLKFLSESVFPAANTADWTKS